MGLFSDIFSPKPAEDAARDKIAGINAGLTSANTTLDSGQAGADALYGQAGNLYDQAGNRTQALYGQMQPLFQQGQGLYDKAYAPFSDLIKSTGQGSQAYADASGANGAEGLARAKALFTSTPGYSSGIDLAMDQNDRRAASRGILASGNTIADSDKLATTYADQNYSNYVSRLAPYLSANQAAVSGGAGVLGGEAGYLGNEAGTFGNEANSLNSLTGARAGTITSQAGADLGVAGTKANLGYGANTAIGSANADKDTAAYSASQNFWNALMGGAKLAVSAATGMPTGGTSFSGPSYTQDIGSGAGSYKMPVF